MGKQKIAIRAKTLGRSSCKHIFDLNSGSVCYKKGLFRFYFEKGLIWEVVANGTLIQA